MTNSTTGECLALKLQNSCLKSEAIASLLFKAMHCHEIPACTAFYSDLLALNHLLTKCFPSQLLTTRYLLARLYKCHTMILRYPVAGPVEATRRKGQKKGKNRPTIRKGHPGKAAYCFEEKENFSRKFINSCLTAICATVSRSFRRTSCSTLISRITRC